jgi:hypothetical protein
MDRYLSVATYIILALAAAAQSQRQRWTEHTYPKDGFAISAPATVEVHEESNGVRVYSIQVGRGSVFSIHVGETGASEMQCAAMLKSKHLRDQENQTQPIFPNTMKGINISGHPGVEYENKMDIDQVTYHVIWREYCIESKGFFLGFFYPINQPRPGAASRVLGSFRLLKTASP